MRQQGTPVPPVWSVVGEVNATQRAFAPLETVAPARKPQAHEVLEESVPLS